MAISEITFTKRTLKETVTISVIILISLKYNNHVPAAYIPWKTEVCHRANNTPAITLQDKVNPILHIYMNSLIRLMRQRTREIGDRRGIMKIYWFMIFCKGFVAIPAVVVGFIRSFVYMILIRIFSDRIGFYFLFFLTISSIL